MSRLPSLKPRQVIAALERAGFVVARIAGSHYQMFNEQSRRYATVPHHNRDLPKERWRQSSSKQGFRGMSS